MYQLFIEKKPPFRGAAVQLKQQLENVLGYALSDVRLIQAYYKADPFSEQSIAQVFSEPYQDIVSDTLDIVPDELALRVEYQPGQFDQRAYWAQAALELIGESSEVHSATIYLIRGLAAEDEELIENVLINPIERRRRALDETRFVSPRHDDDVSFVKIENFAQQDPKALIERYELAMNEDDLRVIQASYQDKDLRWTELKLLDTYWSDHCRHTTFLTELEHFDLEQLNIPTAQAMHEVYLKARTQLTNKPVSLMDLAVWSMREFRTRPDHDLEISEEINACSIKRQVNGADYLIMFKNETHNHPTEMEPFGGAATCLGGAIRDPLSGRSDVYQSMRITGAKDPMLDDTLPGKLPQAYISKTATEGFSSYGNQIGLNTGYVKEFYHPGFEAKRMELGFVIAAAPAAHVTRGNPKPGDRLLLVGGATGRDGIGGAAGSSKEHHEEVMEGASAEVQKGHAAEERKLIRFYRHPEIGPKIIRSNDLGAGGISVAFGELADGLELEISQVPVKYPDIYPWEMLLSESQERMALVVAPEDVAFFKAVAQAENLSCSDIGAVIEEPVFRIKHDGRVLVELSRDLMNSSGASRTAKVQAEAVSFEDYPYGVVDERRNELMQASQQGMVEYFDASFGGRNLLNPYGGKTQKTFVDGMVSLVPAPGNETTVSTVSMGYDPHIATWSPYHGGEYAVLESIARNLVLGGDIQGMRMTFQEYYERLGEDPTRWAKPYLSLLGANRVLRHFGLPSIGGKDSMSGSFQAADAEIKVPPTLVSFAVNTGDVSHVISPELKPEKSHLVLFRAYKQADMSFDLERTQASYEQFREELLAGNVLAASVVTDSLERSLINMAQGNQVGAEIEVVAADLYNSIVAQVKQPVADVIGQVGGNDLVINGRRINLNTRLKTAESTLEELYPLSGERVVKLELQRQAVAAVAEPKSEVRVLLPIFPGTNGEEDLARAFEAAGAKTKKLVFTNESTTIDQAYAALVAAMEECDILALPGGVSAADEPDGAAKFINTIMRQPTVQSAFEALIARGGYVLGIGNGFQALVKLGVFQANQIEAPEAVDMTLSTNSIGRHIAKMVSCRMISNASPWLQQVDLGAEYILPLSSGSARFYRDEAGLEELQARAQIVMTYQNDPTGSSWGIAGLLSPNGQILGLMVHPERAGVAINIPEPGNLGIFESIVNFLQAKQ